jgi:UDP-N-acetylglucosamine 2-epimerase (non-hydrolysing)
LKLAEQNPRLRFLYPVHPNPHVQAAANKHLARCSQVFLVKPMDYPEFVSALLAADLVLTDSGGVQEEAPALGKRILVLRETTERPEGIHAGVAELVGTDCDRIVSRATELLRTSHSDQVISPYGDGQAARRIVQTLRDGTLSQAFVPGVAKPVRRARAA